MTNKVSCQFLAAFASQFAEPPVLFPGADDTVLFMHRNRGVLSEGFRFYLWESPLLPQIVSKRMLADVAARFDLPVPRTITLKGDADLRITL